MNGQLKSKTYRSRFLIRFGMLVGVEVALSIGARAADRDGRYTADQAAHGHGWVEAANELTEAQARTICLGFSSTRSIRVSGTGAGSGAVVRSEETTTVGSGLLLAAAKYAIGRICLHFVAMSRDHQVKWHCAGIRRELPRLSLRHDAALSKTLISG
jgi:hypothetical protein